MAEIGDDAILHLEVDRHLGAAKAGMGNGRGVGVGQALQPGDVGGEGQYLLIVDLVDHGAILASPQGPAIPGGLFASRT